MSRILKHLFPPLTLKKVFSGEALSKIESCIAESEKEHSAEIRFAVELSLQVPQLLRDETAKSQALEVFSRLRVWDTEHNNGVLIYLLLAERNIEIVADRNAFKAIGEAALNELCRQIERSLAAGNHIDGICDGIHRLGKMLAPHFPPERRVANELSDKAEIVR